jgi:hypothetical protein
MTFNSYEELKAAVEARRKAVLTLEVDLGSDYSQEYEDAKKELANAKAMASVVGKGGFLGGDNITPLQEKVDSLKPVPNSVWVQYSRLDLGEWAALLKMSTNSTAIEQYEKVLQKTFIGVYGQDPVKPDETPEGWVTPEPLSTDPRLLSSKGADGILPGGALNSVIQAFMNWQNSGGDVTVRPTRSGRD